MIKIAVWFSKISFSIGPTRIIPFFFRSPIIILFTISQENVNLGQTDYTNKWCSYSQELFRLVFRSHIYLKYFLNLLQHNLPDIQRAPLDTASPGSASVQPIDIFKIAGFRN